MPSCIHGGEKVRVTNVQADGQEAGIASQRRWRVLIRIFCMSLAGIVAAIGGCAPLPGNSLDPVYLYLNATAGSSMVSEKVTAKDTKQAPGAETRATELTVWTGRYQDSRGGGDITMALVRGTTTTSGAWRLRTGGGGPVSIIGEKGKGLQLHMENIGRECPGVFEGTAEFSEAMLTGTYHGKDCDGLVSDGRLELKPR
jgi:hypothetical protein